MYFELCIVRTFCQKTLQIYDVLPFCSRKVNSAYTCTHIHITQLERVVVADRGILLIVTHRMRSSRSPAKSRRLTVVKLLPCKSLKITTIQHDYHVTTRSHLPRSGLRLCTYEKGLIFTTQMVQYCAFWRRAISNTCMFLSITYLTFTFYLYNFVFRFFSFVR